jgi:hypothetical protein
MAVTVAVVIENVCSSIYQKGEHVTFRTCIQTRASFAIPVAQKPDKARVCSVCPESDQYYNLT